MFAQQMDRQGGEVQSNFHITFIHMLTLSFRINERIEQNRFAGPVLKP